jgi:hypothetical protein
MVADIETKFAYIDALPFLIWRCDEPEIALRFVATYDAQMSSEVGKAKMHRVAHLFASATQPSFRNSMLAWDHRQEMDPHLRGAITSYQLGRSDEGPGEGLHSVLAHVAHAKANASSKYWSASMRLHANLAFYATMVAAGRYEAFEKSFVHWKVLTQPSFSKQAKWIQHRIRTSKFLDIIYRAGDNAAEDWGALGKCMKAFMATAPKPPPTINVQLQRDYVRSVLEVGGVYSIPDLPDIPDISACGDSSIAGLICEASLTDPSKCVVFQVLDLDPCRYATVETSERAIIDSFTCPAQVQFYRPWLLREDYPPASLTIFNEGLPCVKDILDMAQWGLFRVALRRWRKVAVSDAGQCWECSDAVFVNVAWEGRFDLSVPTLVVLEELHARHWKAGVVEGGRHTNGGATVFALVPQAGSYKGSSAKRT